MCNRCDGAADAYWHERRIREGRESVDRQLRLSCLPRDYGTGARATEDIPPSCAAALDLLPFLGTPDVPGLFLFGPSKSFKTTIAAAWLARCIRAERVGRFVDVTDLMTDVQRSYRDDDFESRAEIVDHYALAPLLVFDDLGQEKASHHAGEVLRQILDRRRRDWSSGRWLIVTSNFTPEQLRDRFEEEQTGNAILHRIAQLTVAVPMGSQQGAA